MTFRVLTVCTANVCRSPLAEALLRHRLDPGRFVVESAGVRALDGGRTDANVVQRLTRLGIATADLVPRQLTPEIVRQADLILTATRDHRGQVLEVFPGALRRTFTVLEFAALVSRAEGADPVALVRSAAMLRSEGPPEVDIDDPIGRSDAFHDAVAAQIEDAVTAIAERLNG
ncbi:low molecular weight phosphatase family protein [Aeromicrobium piscarium]|uniref:Low molecular weight phosphatase family protein n=1 Tax=Aeromicrobium piscarium TaxID=2590901 RepID=A0A554RXD4_9ACTN|nr:low molecular weight phosphatase family protein [Aeromicrobium piscarium]TSD58758.1 low molecular weight phosphatase family protein [Aeromicrobium piscarium]